MSSEVSFEGFDVPPVGDDRCEPRLACDREREEKEAFEKLSEGLSSSWGWNGWLHGEFL